jgi:hypothetical protein
MYSQLTSDKESNVFIISSNITTMCMATLTSRGGMGDYLLQISDILGQAADSGLWTLISLTKGKYRGWVNSAFMDWQL